VVVLDNGSTDGTLDILKSIRDERLVLYSNGTNRGGLYNVVHVIAKARGNFLVFSTDKDHINPDEIHSFQSFLKQNPNLACGYCEFNSVSKFDFETFPKGYQAAASIGHQGRHPTGYFFRNDLLRSINHVTRFSDYNFVDVFPLDFILGELCLKGDGAIYHRALFTLESPEMAAKHKSYNAPGTTKEAFFSPEGRLKIAVSYARHIDTLELSWSDRESLITNSFVREFTGATIGYRFILKNKYLCKHYCMDSRGVGVAEMVRIGIVFFTRYIRETESLSRNTSMRELSIRVHLAIGIIGKFLSSFHKFFR
jgi:glycosyltransferase involved in cell wall biosynthesis